MKSLTLYITTLILLTSITFPDEFDKCKIRGFERAEWSKPDSVPISVETDNSLKTIFNVYPNPTNGLFIVTSSIALFATEITITDVLGDKIFENIKFKIIDSISIEIVDERFIAAPRGIYFVRLHYPTKFTQFKLIKTE